MSSFFIRRFLAVIAMAVWSVTALSAQSFFEQLNGPTGFTYENNLGADPDGGIWAYINGTLLRTTDAGITWQESTVNWGPSNVQFLSRPGGPLLAHHGNVLSEYDPTTDTWADQVMGLGGYANLTIDSEGGLWRTGGSNGAVFRSDDGGVTFTEVVQAGQTQQGAKILAPLNAEHALYATWSGLNERVYHISAAGAVQLVLTTNNGVELLAFNPWTGTAFVADGTGTGFKRSTDYGFTWTNVSVPGINLYGSFFQMLFRPGGITLLRTSQGIYRSTDDGLTWTVVTNNFIGFAQLIVSSDELWLFAMDVCGRAQLQRSADEGQTITDVSDHLKRTITYRLQQDGTGTLYALTCRAGAYMRSGDGGETWTPLLIPVPDTLPIPTTRLALLPDGVMLALTHSNTRGWRSTDGGASWTQLSLPVNAWSEEILTMEADPWGNAYLYTEITIYKSADGGDTWQALNVNIVAPSNNFQQRTLRFHPNGDLYWSDLFGTTRYIAAADTTEDVENVMPSYFEGYVFEVAPNGDLFYTRQGNFGLFGAQLYRRTAAGEVHIAFFQDKPVRRLTWNAAGHLFAVTEPGLYRSTDDGVTWSFLGEMPQAVFAMTEFIAGADQHLYVAVAGYPVYRSVLPTDEVTYVRGVSWLDTNDDCAQQPATEPSRPGTTVRATGLLEYSALTGADGQYTLVLPGGDYTVNVVPPNALFETCSAGVTISANNVADTVQAPLGLKPVAWCPYLRVGIGTTVLRRCFENTYAVQYCNDGTADASGVTVEITLDTFLQLLNTTLPVAAQNGTTYSFSIGTLTAGACGTLELTVLVSCDAPLGQLHCAAAYILPDSLCLPDLPDLSQAQDCQINVGSYDPNDKRAFVGGVESPATVSPGAPVEYVIRFENTGTDTAFHVVIEDRLSVLFDPSSVEVLAASHPYSLELHDARTLRFVFADIALPHAGIDPTGAQGFVKFRVRPVAGLSVGTLLRNDADIFFDLNPPIRTNTAELVVDWPVRTVEPAAGRVTAFPNPFDQAVTFVVNGARASDEMVLVLTDALGRVVRQQRVRGPEFRLERAGLVAGVYYFVLNSADGRLGAGRILCTGR